MVSMAPTAVTKGMTFRSVIADSNSLWETVRPSGREAWICVCIDEPYKMGDGREIPSDFTGTEKAFTKAEILGAVGWQERLVAMIVTGDGWWDQQEIGTIVHYCDGFNIFFRGVVEIGECRGETVKGIRVTALVGPDFKPNDENADGTIVPNTFVQGIRPFDLPHVGAGGEISMGRYADKIGDFWQPSHTCMYEWPQSSYRTKGVDPRPLPARDLTPPQRSAEQVLMAECEDLRRWVASQVNESPREGTTLADMVDRLANLAENMTATLDMINSRV